MKIDQLALTSIIVAALEHSGHFCSNKSSERSSVVKIRLQAIRKSRTIRNKITIIFKATRPTAL